MISKQISAFDLDYTLLNDNSSFRFGRYLCSSGDLSKAVLLFMAWCQIRHVFGFLSIAQLHKNGFKICFKGRSSSIVSQWVEKFLASEFKNLLYQPAIDCLRRAQNNGHQVVILSSAPDFIVAPIAKLLGVDLWKATEYAVDKNGLFSHISQLMLGDDKALFIKQLQESNGCDTKDITAYSDSHFDLSFLKAAGTPVGVNPNRKLRAICKQKQWMVI